MQNSYITFEFRANWDFEILCWSTVLTDWNFYWLILINCLYYSMTLIDLIVLVLIPYVGCISFWIWKLIKVSFSLVIIQKVHYNLAYSSIYHEVICIQWISLILFFMTIIYLSFVKSEVSLTTLHWKYIIYQVKSWISHLNSGRIC